MMANTRKTLAILFGGRSGEHEVSLLSARSVLPILDPAKYNILPIYISPDGNWYSGDDALAGHVETLTPVTLMLSPGENTLYSLQNAEGRACLAPLAQLDVVFPLLHGTFGEDGTIQGLLELIDIAYVGSGVLASAVGMDKALFKEVMRAHDLPVADSITVTRSEIERDPQAVMDRAEAVLTYPLFTKPANLGSSVGITKCRTRSDLYEGMLEAASYDRRILIERGIPHAREIEVAVLGNEAPQASLAGEVKPAADFYTYTAKYIDGRSQLVIPADLSQEQHQRIQEMAVTAFKAIDGGGMARVDFLLDDQSGELYLSEVNTIPGFTNISMYPKLWEASGLPYAALIDRLIDLALECKTQRDRTERHFHAA